MIRFLLNMVVALSSVDWRPVDRDSLSKGGLLRTGGSLDYGRSEIWGNTLGKAAVLFDKCMNPSRTAGELEAAYQLLRTGSYLTQMGWFRSRRLGYAVDKLGNPIPWYTYPAISFLSKRVKDTMKIFEYGSGQSTLWWAQRTKHIIGCEHNREWRDFVAVRLPKNAELLYFELEIGGQYCKAVQAYTAAFDIIVVDGEDRVNCAQNSLPSLKKSGVILWDNSQHPANDKGTAWLEGEGFKRLDFEGISPVNAGIDCTSIFYRGDNCLGI